MSKSIMIPAIGPNPYVVEINGVRYAYPAGTQQTVPDAVAAIIANDVALRPQEDPNAGADTPAAIKAALDALTARVAALEEGGAGGNVEVIPFEMHVGEQGDITLTTEAEFEDAVQTLADGKILIADVVFIVNGYVVHTIGVLGGSHSETGEPDENATINGCVVIKNGGGNIIAYSINWLPNALTITGYTLQSVEG